MLELTAKRKMALVNLPLGNSWSNLKKAVVLKVEVHHGPLRLLYLWTKRNLLKVASHHRFLAVVEGPKKFFNISDSFQTLIDGISPVTERGSMLVDSHNGNICICLDVDLVFFLAVQCFHPANVCSADVERTASMIKIA